MNGLNYRPALYLAQQIVFVTEVYSVASMSLALRSGLVILDTLAEQLPRKTSKVHHSLNSLTSDNSLVIVCDWMPKLYADYYCVQ